MENTRFMEKRLPDRVPPHNVDAETATLGAILLNPKALNDIIHILRPEDFYRQAHQKIFGSFLSLDNKGEAIDLITLTDELKFQGDLEICGGAAYVSSLTNVVPTSANIEYYAKIVWECSLRRRLIRTASDLTANSYDDSKDARIILEEAERKIFEITDNQNDIEIQKASTIIPVTIEAIEQLYKTKDSYTGIPSGFHELDNLLNGFQDSEFIVIGARPSVGKTALALSMASHMALHKKIPVGFFTLEMSSLALMQRLVSSEARIDSTKIRAGMIRPADFKGLTDAAGLIYEAPLYITDTPSMKLLDLRANARRMKSQLGVKVIFIDYITLVTAENQALPRYEQVAEISRSLKALARELNIPIIALSQVTRDSEGKRPNLANIRESGSIEQDADVVMFLHRDRGTESDNSQVPNNIETELIIAKQRNGPVGTVKIAFIPKYTKFESLTAEPGRR
jgi:replicative DNA helicase